MGRQDGGPIPRRRTLFFGAPARESGADMGQVNEERQRRVVPATRAGDTRSIGLPARGLRLFAAGPPLGSRLDRVGRLDDCPQAVVLQHRMLANQVLRRHLSEAGATPRRW